MLIYIYNDFTNKMDRVKSRFCFRSKIRMCIQYVFYFYVLLLEPYYRVCILSITLELNHLLYILSNHPGSRRTFLYVRTILLVCVYRFNRYTYPKAIINSCKSIIFFLCNFFPYQSKKKNKCEKKKEFNV